MAKIFRRRIIAGTRTYEEVPSRWKSEVKELLKEDVARGTIMDDGSIFTAEKYEELVGEPYTE